MKSASKLRRDIDKRVNKLYEFISLDYDFDVTYDRSSWKTKEEQINKLAELCSKVLDSINEAWDSEV